MKKTTIVLTLLSCNAVMAGPFVFRDRSQFEKAAPDLPVEGFEVPFETSSSVSFLGFSAGEESSASTVKSRTDYVSSGERSMGFTWNGDGLFKFTFDPAIDAFAADILDFGTCCDATILTATDESAAWTLTAATGTDRPRGNLQFFGLVSDRAFSELIFTSDRVSDNDLIVFDEVAIRAVPEPHGMSALAMACCCLLSIRRRTERGSAADRRHWRIN